MLQTTEKQVTAEGKQHRGQRTSLPDARPDTEAGVQLATR